MSHQTALARRATWTTLRTVIATIVAIATLALYTGVGVADQIVNDLDGTVDATAESITLTLGPTGSDGTVGFYLVQQNDDGKNGCNIAGGPTSNLVASVTSSNTAVATVPSTVSFANCGATPTIDVTRVGLGTSTVTLAFSSSTNTSGTFDYDPATFTVTVQDPPAPANTAPALNLPASPVTAEATSASGAVVSYTATATDAEDDPDPTPACLPASGTTFAIGTTTVNCTVTDLNGATTIGSFSVLVQDTTDPLVSITTTAVKAATDWYNIASSGTSGIVISVTASDAVGASTLSCLDGAAPLTLTAGGATLSDGTHAVSCTATDAAGNSGSDSETFKVDQTAPTMDATVAPAPNTNGWNNTAVSVSYTCSDATSGIDPAYGCPAADTPSDNGLYTFNKSTADNAGNVITPSFTVRIDKDKPTITGSASPAANADGWNNTNVTVHFDCFDSLSTIDSCTADTVLGQGAGQSVTGTAVDKAGNSESATVSGINVDKTHPSINYTIDGTIGDNGWYTSSVVVTFTCTDGLSGVKTLTAPVTLASDGADQSTTGTCVDKAGNSSSATASDIDIDQSKPVITGSRLPLANANGWNNGSVTVSFECADVGPSGIATNDVAGATLSGEGDNQSVTNTGTCVDAAGNVADPATVGDIRIDLTKPVITGSATPAPNGDGWNNTDVVVAFSCGDALSGVDLNTVAGTTLTGDGADQEFTNTGSCTDEAGNVADPVTVSNIDIDKTAPSLNVSGPLSGTYDICSTGGVAPARPSFAPSDALSGLDGTEGDSWSTPSSPSGVGTYTYSAHAQDTADNPTSETRIYNVVYGAGAFSGVLQPINADGSSRFKLGSTVPVKFRLACGSAPITNAVARLTVKQGDTKPDPGTDEAISTAASTTGNLFRFDSTAGQYIFNLSTKSGYTNPGGSTPIQFTPGTWTLGITFDDGTSATVKIQLWK